MPQAYEAPGAEALQSVYHLALEGEAEKAAEVLHQQCREAPASSRAAARHAVLDAYINKDKVEDAYVFALEALHEPKGWEQILPSSLDAVLRSLLQTQLHGSAVKLLEGMCQPGAPAPSDQIFNMMLDATVRTRSWTEAWDVLDLLLRCGRKADKYFVSILTKSLESSTDKRCVRRGISLVEAFIDQQREDVDEIVFNSLLNVLGQTGDMMKLQQTLNKMNEYGVSPSAVTFGTVVKAYGRARDTDSVIKVWQQMRSRCLGINPVTCGCVLDACVKCNSLDKAMAIFQEMRMQGMHKNTVLYATLIKGLAKIRDLQGAMNLYHEMRMEQVPCNLVTFNSLMDVCVRCSDLQTAAYFLQDMMQMGIEPDLITFSTLIKGYSQIGQVHKALALWKELKSRNLKCDEIMYNSLIDGCAKSQKLQEGLKVFQDMLQSRVQPSNITFSILVKLHFEVGQIEEAFRLVEDMNSRYRCMPGRIVYTVLLRCSCQAGKPALALAAQLLTDLMAKKNCKLPEQVMVSSLLSACVQHGDFDTAARLVREFAVGSRRSCPIGLDSLKLLFEALGSQREQLGVELIEYLKGKSMPTTHIATLQASLAAGKEEPGWSPPVEHQLVQADATGYEAFTPSEEMGDGGMTAHQSGQMGCSAGAMLQMPQAPMAMPPLCPDMYMNWDQGMASYATAHNPFLASYSQAAAAAACAATAAYNQHMARYAAAAAAAYPPYSTLPPFLPSLEANQDTRGPSVTWASPATPAAAASPASPEVPSTAAPSPGTVVPPVPESFQQSTLEEFKAVPPVPAGLTLTPLPAGPVSPRGAISDSASKPKALIKENARKGKEGGWKPKGKFNNQNKENWQEKHIGGVQASRCGA
mmetsp:Transcript_612/g.1552  ORF Transcript_612/g.1552 Transcript_612/m.1552 type:complete len:865 (-) Transcript_612:332-2926(-)